MAGPNPFTGAAAASIGLGDQLADQAEAEILARRKKQLDLANAPTAAYGALAMGTGLNNGNGAVAALLGTGGLGG